METQLETEGELTYIGARDNSVIDYTIGNIDTREKDRQVSCQKKNRIGSSTNLCSYTNSELKVHARYKGKYQGYKS